MPKIEVIYAYITTEEGPDDEGIVAAKIGGIWHPLIGADEARIRSLKPVAMRVAQVTGKRITLVKFIRGDFEEIGEN